jgi:hypothetical protein
MCEHPTGARDGVRPDGARRRHHHEEFARRPAPHVLLRRRNSTLRVAAGSPVKVVSDVLGHSTIQQAATTYVYGEEAVTADWMQRCERALAAARAPANEAAERLTPR